MINHVESYSEKINSDGPHMVIIAKDTLVRR